MTLDPRHLTLLVLGARDQALSQSSNTLTTRLTGKPGNDNAIRQELQDIAAERFAIASRRSAITAGGKFTAPDDEAITALQEAITNLHTAVAASATAKALIKLTTQLLQEFGSADT